MKRIVFIPILLFCLVGTSAAQSLKDGSVAIEENRFEEAIEIITAVIEQDEKFADAYFYRSNAYAQIDETEKGLADITKAIELEPENAGYYNYRGVLYSLDGQNDKALSDFSTTISIAPTSPMGYKNRANTYKDMGNSKAAKKDFAMYEKLVGGYGVQGPEDALLKLSAGNYEGAIKVLKKEIKRDSKNPALYHLLGAAYEAVDQPSDAFANYSLAIKLDSNFFHSYITRGDILFTSGYVRDAIDDFNHVERLGEADANLFRSRAWGFALIDSHEMAIRDIKTALEMDTANSRIFFTAGDIFRRADSFALAIVNYNGGAELDKSNDDIYRWRARAYSGTENYEAAIADYKVYVAAFPDNLSERVNLGDELRLAENYEEAIEVLEAVIAEDAEMRFTYRSLSDVYFDMDEYAKSIDSYLAYQKLVEKENDKFFLANSYGSLAWKYLFLQDFAKAEEAAREGLRIDSKSDWIKTNLALSLLYQDKFEEAKEIYNNLKEVEYGDGVFADTFLEDFAVMEEKGITHPDVEKIRKLLERYTTKEVVGESEAADNEMEKASDKSKE